MKKKEYGNKQILKFVECSFIVLILIFLCFFEANAATINASSCSQANVQSAINSASNGDTVTVPAGTCTWSSAVTISTKAITIQGAGIDLTTITGNVDTIDGALVITSHATLNTTIKGFTFNKSNSTPYNPAISLHGSYSNTGTIRITASKINTSSTIIQYNDNQAALIDNCTFIISGNTECDPLLLHGDSQASWTRADNFGTGTGQIIMEDNTFDATSSTYNGGGWALVFCSFDGARFTVRHNTFKKCYLDAHPNTWAHAYGVRQGEIYNNTFTGAVRVADWKAGTAVFYSNSWDGGSGITLHAPTLYYASDTNGQCCLTSNLTNAACTQRPGMGYNYALDPIYIWGNTNNTPQLIGEGDYPDNCGNGQLTANALRLNTEYYLSQKSGYTAYTYPHPLRNEGPPDTQAPTIPTNLSASAVSSSQINLTWTASTDNVGVTGYKIYRCTGSGCTPSSQLTTVAGASYSNTGLSAGTVYVYAVSAYDAAGNESAKSSSASATTQAGDTTPPTISSVSASSITKNSATITWTTNESSDSQVEYGLTTSYGNSTTLNTSMVTSHSQSLSGLSASTLYHYRVKSKDAAGNLATSGDYTFTTTASDTTPPTISSVSASSITQNSATITWTTNESSDSQVEYGLTTSYGSSTTLNTSMVTSHSQSLSGLSASTLYHYRVKSKDAAGNLATSGDYTFTTTASDTTPPTISSVSASSITQNSATITWTTNESSDSQVEYGLTTSYGNSTTLNTSLVTSHSQTLSGLSASTLYHYRVKSKDAAGNLATSGDYTFTTTASDTTPPTISSVSASSITKNSATITWTTNESSDSQVEYGLTTSYGNSTTLNTSMVTSHSQTLSGLSASTLYHYRVKSKDAAGNLATSGDYTFTTTASDTTPPTISSVSASSITQNSATITWTTNESSDSQVEYGLTTSYGSSTTLNTSMVTSHSQSLSGLSASTLYHYRVKSKDAAGNLATSGDYTFTTTASDIQAPHLRISQLRRSPQARSI